jgi:parallel beta-helix repeat protein
VRRMSKRLLPIVAFALVLAGLPIEASADVVHVHPGPNAITNAIRRAVPGDRLVIHGGLYREDIRVGKRLSLVAAPGDTPTIDATCDSFTAVDITANRVLLRGLRVVGGTYYEVDTTFVGNVTLQLIRMRDTCGNALYGVNVYQTGTVLVARSRARGFEDAGIYVGGIDDGPVTVRRNTTFDNNRGILVEDVAPNTVRVAYNTSRVNDLPGLGPPSGIWLHEADGVEVVGNTFTDNDDFGIDIDLDSSNNEVRGNTATGNGTFDIRDQGTGNCFSGNVYGTSNPSTLPSC